MLCVQAGEVRLYEPNALICIQRIRKCGA
jgi:hypothetical protein